MKDLCHTTTSSRIVWNSWSCNKVKGLGSLVKYLQEFNAKLTFVLIKEKPSKKLAFM
jgi:hypothetical protein